MANVQVRDIGTVGVLKDPSSWQLPMTAWTDCLNVRFNASTISHAGVWKSNIDLGDIVPVVTAVFHIPSVEQDHLIVADQNTNGVYSITGNGQPTKLGTVGSASSPEASWTWTVLADVFYINKQDSQPEYLLPDGVALTPLANMDSAWTCRSLRSYKDMLVALNVTDAEGVQTDNMVKWSDATLAGQIPTNWSQTQSVSSLGGSNVLAQMSGPIVDGLSLGDNFMIYGRDEVWAMEYIDSGTYPFTFRRLFGTGGMKSTNCAVEVEGVHYVLGRHDLYRHDGNSIESLSAGKLNDWFWKSQFRERTDNPCFVAHNETKKEVVFFYQSQDSSNDRGGCDRGLVFNYVANTWSIISAPNVLSCTTATPNSSKVWDSLVGSWDAYQGTWSDGATASIPIMFCGSAKSSKELANRLMAYDDSDGPATGSIDPDTNQDAVLERVGILLDPTQGGSIPITQAIQAQQIYPLIALSSTMQVEVGQSYNPSQDVSWVTSVQYDPVNDWQIDTRANGRFLAVRFTIPYQYIWKFSGYDLLMTDGGSR